MKTNASLDIFAYWDELRGDRAAPLRSEIDPAPIRHLLPDLFVLTETADAAPVFRLTGTRLYNLFGRELSDTPFSAIWQPDAAHDACRIANGVLQHQRPVVFDILSETVTGLAVRGFEMLLLPLAVEPYFPARLLGCLISEPPLGDLGQSFKPLSLTKSRLLDVSSSQLMAQRSDFGYAINRSVSL